MSWDDFDKYLYRWEAENPQKRITFAWFTGDDRQHHYSGKFSEFDIGPGENSFRLSSGEVITL
jgi:hypothetical protein